MKTLFTPFLIGSLLVAIANVFIGFNIITTKQLLKSTIPIPALLTLRYMFGCLILLPIFLISKHRFKFYVNPDQKFNKDQKILYILMALLGGSIFNFIYMFGMQNTTAITTGMTGSTVPLLVVAFSAVFLKQRIHMHHILCAILVALGIAIIVFSNQRTPSVTNMIQTSHIPVLIVFIAMIPEAIFNVFAAKLPNNIRAIPSALLINFINFLVCVPFFVYSMFYFPLNNISKNDLTLCFMIGLFSGALYYSFYSSGIQKINAQTAGLLTGVVPISTTILAVLLLKEHFDILSLLGMVLVLLSIYLSIRFSNPNSHVSH